MRDRGTRMARGSGEPAVSAAGVREESGLQTAGAFEQGPTVRQLFAVAIGAALLLMQGAIAQAGPTDAEKCEADKLRRAGKFAFCRMKAESKAVKTGAAPDYTKCDTKLADKFAKAELKWGAECLTTGDAGAIQTQVAGDTDDVAFVLSGGMLASCGDGVVNVAGEQCDGSDLDGYTCGSFRLGGALSCDSACDFDASGCFDCGEYGGVFVGGACWFASASVGNCTDTCNNAGLAYSEATRTYAGSDGTNEQCEAVLDALGILSGAVAETDVNGIGCSTDFSIRLRDTSATTADAFNIAVRACACE